MNTAVFALAFLGGALTIASPCVLPVLPFVFSRTGRPFVSHGLPMLLGLGVAFAAVASLAAVGGGWAVALNQYGRYAALAWIALCGLALWWPPLAEWLARPFVALGERLLATGSGPSSNPTGLLSSAALGIATGLLWTPCAGPILGLILAGAALNGASAATSLLLLAYAAGACSSLAVALWLGGRVGSRLGASAAGAATLRRVAGAAMLAGAAAIATGLDVRVLSQVSFGASSGLEQSLVDRLGDGAMPPAASAGALAQRGDLAASSARALRTGLPLAAPPLGAAKPLPNEGEFPSLAGATGWIGSPPLTPQGLRGKVVLVDFWTYSCINCLRTLPYVRAWADKYRDAGLVVIGVHAPEFAFEKLPANVRRAVEDLRINFPVAVDSDHAVWQAFGNRYWPAFYFIDAQGRIRHHQFGEGDYVRAEQVLQQLLAEAGRPGVPSGAVAPQGVGVEAAAGPTAPRSVEAYLGHEQAAGFASPGGLQRNAVRAYRGVDALALGQWTLEGRWTAERDRVVSSTALGRITYHFNARDVHLVLGPAPDGRPVRFQVRIDGRAPLADHGYDTDEQGRGSADRLRLYQLLRQHTSAADHTIEIEFLDPGAQAYVFTFG